MIEQGLLTLCSDTSIQCSICENHWQGKVHTCASPFRLDLNMEIYSFTSSFNIHNVDKKSMGLLYYHTPSLSYLHQECLHFGLESIQKYPKFNTTSIQNQIGIFTIKIIRAVDLPNIQYVGRQDPYVKAYLLPWKEAMVTKSVPCGGKNPIWRDGLDDNLFDLLHPYNSETTPWPRLALEIWNENYLQNEKIAACILDLRPLLKFPTIMLERWFCLKMENVENAGRILLSIVFIPQSPSSMQHVFRTLSLQKVGVKLPKCAICEKVVMTVRRGGYRCERCWMDVHQSCMLQANARLACTPRKNLPPSSRARSMSSNKYSTRSSRFSPGFKCDTPPISEQKMPLEDEEEDEEEVYETNRSPRVLGDLHVDFHSLHLCSSECIWPNQHTAQNEGDTYCRITFNEHVVETDAVVKTSDPVFNTQYTYEVSDRCSVLILEVLRFISYRHDFLILTFIFRLFHCNRMQF